MLKRLNVATLLLLMLFSCGKNAEESLKDMVIYNLEKRYTKTEMSGFEAKEWEIDLRSKVDYLDKGVSTSDKDYLLARQNDAFLVRCRFHLKVEEGQNPERILCYYFVTNTRELVFDSGCEFYTTVMGE